MQPAIYIKRTIDFNKGFRSILDVMKLIAVSEYHRLEKELRTFERLQSLLGEFFASVDLRGVRHPFVTPAAAPMGIVAVTSDAGLLGGLNLQVIARATEIARRQQSRLILLGDRGMIYARDSGIPIDHFPGVSDTRRYEQACQVRDHLATEVVAGRLSGVCLVYPRALSFVIHRVEVAEILPFARDISGAIPVQPAILESTPAEVMEYLVFLVLGQKLYEAFGMSRVCEQAARFLHLEDSCSKILDMNKKLSLQYFRRRHEIIDANMRELFASRSVYAK